MEEDNRNGKRIVQVIAIEASTPRIFLQHSQVFGENSCRLRDSAVYTSIEQPESKDLIADPPDENSSRAF
jgi:hypothetical protein